VRTATHALVAYAVLLVLGARDDQLRFGLAQLDRLLGELEIPAERLRIAISPTSPAAAGLPSSRKSSTSTPRSGSATAATC